MRIYMQTPYAPDQQIRFYHLHLQKDLLGGWILVRESGVQGKRGQVTQEYFSDLEEAQHTLEKRRDMQLRRGFRVVFREGAGADPG